MSQEATKRERRISARDDRKRRAAAAQRAARIRQIMVLAFVAVTLVVLVIIAISTSFFGLTMASSPLTSVGRTVAMEGADHVPEGTPLSHKSRPPTSGTHYPVWLQTYGFMNPAPPTGQWLHNLEHGAVAILYNCPAGCPELEQQLKDLYPTLPLGRNARRGMPRALIMPYTDMDKKIAVAAWGWLLELDEFNREEIVKFYESRLDRGPECRDLACP